MTNSNTLHVVDLFCGCGGMSLGSRQAGFKVIAGFDTDKHALKTYKRNFGDDAGFSIDLNKTSPQSIAEHLNLKPEKLDLLIGGPPCQGFSKNVPRRHRFLEDPRNMLVNKFLENVEYLRPLVLIMENVAEIKNGFEGTYTNEIKERLFKAGYEVDLKVIYSPDFGVPQRRRRAVFFANRVGIPVSFPEPTHFSTSNSLPFDENKSTYVTVAEAIGDLPSLEHGQGEDPTEYINSPSNNFQTYMRQDSKVLRDHVARHLTSNQYQRLASITQGQGAKDLPDHLKPKSHYSGAYGRLAWDSIAPTITRWVFHPGSGRFGHPSDVRVITIREAARLQSFSDDFSFCGTYIQKSHQVGNAVPPLVMKALAEKARELLINAK
jgi:DNA (cytosine-5)-methyltransferase 1